jgi:hypothetical protein
MPKWHFVEREVLVMSMSGALRTRQGCSVYACGELKRADLRRSLAAQLRGIAAEYTRAVEPEQHKQNIQRIAESLTFQFKDKATLRDNGFRIGIAQKALNLYLKYLWCLDRIVMPPHCPLDSRIITDLPLTLQERQDLQWTRLDSIDGYQRLVDAGIQRMSEKGYSSLSEWELHEFNSRQ